MIKGMFYVDYYIESLYAQEAFLQGVIETLFKNENEDSVSVKFISAAGGDSCAYALAEAYRRDNDAHIIVTNCSLLFSFPKFIWDAERGVFNLWMWKDDDVEKIGEFVHINDLAEREIREYHNVYKMWRNGALDIWRSWDEDSE